MPNEQLSCQKTKVKDEWKMYERSSDILIEFKSDMMIFMQPNRVFPVPQQQFDQYGHIFFNYWVQAKVQIISLTGRSIDKQLCNS